MPQRKGCIPWWIEKGLPHPMTSYHLDYRYAGDGSVILGSLNPDFINVNGKKKIIEIFGRVFHDPNVSFKKEVPLGQQELYRKAIYASFGFDCLILWDDEMENLSDEEIAGKIRSFTKSRRKGTAQLDLFREVVARRVW